MKRPKNRTRIDEARVLDTDRLTLRHWTAADREPFARLNADPRVMEYFPRVLTIVESDAAFERIQAHFDRHRFGLFAAVLKETNTLIGFVGLAIPSFTAPFTPCVEIGWRIACRYWG